MTFRIAVLLVALGGYVSLMNWWTIYASYRDNRFHSSVPLVGALLLASGLSLVPASRHYAWMALLLDYGTLIFFVCVPRLAKEFWSSRAKS